VIATKSPYKYPPPRAEWLDDSSSLLDSPLAVSGASVQITLSQTPVKRTLQAGANSVLARWQPLPLKRVAC
jgi:hypothetical protein